MRTHQRQKRPRLRDRAPYLVARLGLTAAVPDQRLLRKCSFAGGVAFHDFSVATSVEPELARARWHAY